MSGTVSGVSCIVERSKREANEVVSGGARWGSIAGAWRPEFRCCLSHVAESTGGEAMVVDGVGSGISSGSMA